MCALHQYCVASLVTPPPSRSDGVRNRRRLLRAGAQELALSGAGASITAIAERAGLHRATFFRHFPTKGHLISAIMANHYVRLRAAAESLAASALSPRDALVAYMERAAVQIAPDRAFFQAVHMTGAESDEIRESARDLDHAIGRLLKRAQDAGTIRGDLVANDIQTLVQAVTGSTSAVHGTAAGLWRRYLTIAIDGMGPAPRRPLTTPALQFEDFSAIQGELTRRREHRGG